MIPIEDQEIIISAICYSEDHYTDPIVYSKKALENKQIKWTIYHEEFIHEYIEEYTRY